MAGPGTDGHPDDASLAAQARPDVWGGVECTVVRRGETYVDELARTGHDARDGDLDLIAGLGVRAVRYPVLWERVAPDGLGSADWTWPDQRLAHLRRLGLRPIVGLVHHGSGPRHTSLVDESFVEGLARYAGAVAARYPWVDDWTPVNEPLTTARFSGLYGHWYPHGRDDSTFARALVVQCKAIVRAMEAIRAVNPRARLVQTEDLGRCFSTPATAAEASFQNERRWASLDLLCGRLAPGDAMWTYLCRAGVAEADLDWFRAHPCPPAIVGINHYLNSERLLDERQERYPAWSHGDAAHPYADVDAVRVLPSAAVGPYARLREAWERYHLPLAVTEAHHGSTREEQLRWLLEVWDAAVALAEEDVDLRAVTVWSLFGAYDWNSLLLRDDGYYEPGAFDVRVAPGRAPRPTAIAGLVREIATGRQPSHPVLATPGWWRRPVRAAYGAVDVVPRVGDVPGTGRVPVLERLAGVVAASLLIRGAGTALGMVLVAACDLRGLPYYPLTPAGEDTGALRVALDRYHPWAAIDAGSPAVASVQSRPEDFLSTCERYGCPVLRFAAPLQQVDVSGTTTLPDARAGAPATDASSVLTMVGVPDFKTALGADQPLLSPWSLTDGTVPMRDETRPVAAAGLVSIALDLLIDGARGAWTVQPVAIREADPSRETVGARSGR